MAAFTLSRCLEQSARYPTNLRSSPSEEHELHMYRARLKEREQVLFETDPEDIAVDLAEHDDVDQYYTWKKLSTSRDLQNALSVGGMHGKKNPCNTIMFWHAASSRDPLRITKEMAYFTLTLFQVNHFLLDFLFLFGWKTHEQGSYFSNFRHSLALSSRSGQKPLPRLGKSGDWLEICYNLQGVERDPRSPGRPWSIRQTIMYHSLDLTAGTCTWLIIKGNEEMKKRVKKLKEREEAAWMTPSQGVSNSLVFHDMISVWSAENWRWYLDYLEDCLNEVSRRSLQIEVTAQVTAPQTPDGSCDTVNRQDNSRGAPSRSLRGLGVWRPLRWLYRDTQVSGTDNELELGVAGPKAVPELEPSKVKDLPFNFVQLQRVHHVEDKVDEVLRVLQGNLATLAKLKMFYRSLGALRDMPPDIRNSDQTREDIARFSEKLETIESDINMHRARSESLLRLAANRKTLLSDILSYHNSEISKASAISTEGLTRKMNALTSRTTQETVMMRVISLVTVVFLPGTFISTLMSTDIVRYPDGRDGLTNGVVSNGAVMLYLALTLPLTAVTLVAWYLFFLYVKREKRDASEV